MLKTPRKAFAIRFICFLSLTLLLCGCGILEDTTNPIGMIVSSFRSTAEPAGVDEITTALEEQAGTGTVTASTDESVTATPDPTEAAEFAETAVSIAAEAVEIVEEAAAEEATPTPTIQELEIWIPPQFDPAQDTPAGRALQDAVNKYMEQYPDVHITLTVKATTGDASVLNTLTAANNAAKSVLPSLVLLSRSDMESAVQRGLLQQITTSLFNDTSSWYSYARQAAVVDNNVYGIPVLGDAIVLVYRTAKLGADADVSTWSSILTHGLPIGFAPASSSSMFGAFIYLNAGGKMTNDQGQPYLDQTKLVDALNFFVTGGQNGAFPPSIAQLLDQTQVWQRFMDGTLNIIISPYSSYSHYRTQEMSFAALPTQEEPVDYPMVSSWNLVMTEQNTALQGTAVAFAEYMAGELVNDEFSMRAGYLPVRTAGHTVWETSAEYETVSAIADKASLVPNNQVSNKLLPVINNAILQVIKNALTPEAAAEEAAASFN